MKWNEDNIKWDIRDTSQYGKLQKRTKKRGPNGEELWEAEDGSLIYLRCTIVKYFNQLGYKTKWTKLIEK